MAIITNKDFIGDFTIEDVESINFDNIKDTAQESTSTEEEEELERFEVAFDEDEYDKGVTLGSLIAGMLAPILAIGVPPELAVELVGNERTIAYNKEMFFAKIKNDILDEEVNIE